MVTETTTSPPLGPTLPAVPAAPAGAGSVTASSPTARGAASSFATSLKDRLKRTSSFATGSGSGAGCTTLDPTTTGGAPTVESGVPPAQPASKDDVWSLLSLRCRAWKLLVKTLIVYFNNIADVQEASARGYAKAAGVLVSPQNFGGGHFIEVQDPAKRRAGAPPGGILAVLHGLHHTTRMFAEEDARCSNVLVENAINTLDRLKKQMKTRGDELTNESRSSATQMERMRELTKKKFVELGRAIETYKYQPGADCLDPWLANHAVRVQLNNQLNAERDYHAAAASALQAFADFEKNVIVHDVRVVMSTFASNYGSPTSSAAAEVQAAVAAMQASVENLAEDAEWNAFLVGNGSRLVSIRETVPALSDVPYEYRDDELCRAVRQGALERKRFGGRKQEVWVLTPGGWMHSFPTGDLLAHATPEKSIYVAGSQLHPPHAVSESHPREFSLLEKGKGGAFHLSEHRYRLRAANHDDAASWWKALSQFARTAPFTDVQRPSKVDTGDNVKLEQGKDVPTAPVVASEEAAQRPETAEEPKVEELGVQEKKTELKRETDNPHPITEQEVVGSSGNDGGNFTGGSSGATEADPQVHTSPIAAPPAEVADTLTNSAPVDAPSQAVAGLSQASAGPSQAAASPSQPVVSPSQPVAGPSQPVSGPSQPVAGPSQPVAGPSQPVAGPSQPVAGPPQPVAVLATSGGVEPTTSTAELPR